MNDEPASDEENTSETANTSIEDAVDRFLGDTDTALGEYDRGYTDADATLSVVRSHLQELRAAVDGDDD
ncbi:hypothetical protein GRS48_04925 [Halorubrum sp. JWXQ-INN 858]|uniref:hypothetical protein n=1 Tax=Halorubrum sp. JWXQ-INN 858 TaxID=2690782 RepID=UPI001356AA76|nr:hypothetical protein [Halorubrum sp. JWXQ-INN 858]MWV64166.1 hypothetical protein [Halorubrum sp. JWXQ-INN 858]